MTRKTPEPMDGTEANTDYINDPKKTTAAIKGYEKNLTLDAHVPAQAVVNIDPDAITFGCKVRADKLTASGTTLPDALWNIYTTALKNNQLAEVSDNPEVFAEHKGCPECGTTVEDPEHTTEECPNCDSPIDTISVPSQMIVTQTIEVPDEIAPIETDEDLEDALRLILKTTDLTLT